MLLLCSPQVRGRDQQEEQPGERLCDSEKGLNYGRPPGDKIHTIGAFECYSSDLRHNGMLGKKRSRKNLIYSPGATKAELNGRDAPP